MGSAPTFTKSVIRPRSQTGADTIVEYCSFARRPYTVIGDRSIVSCCFAGQNRNHKEIVIPADVVVYSTPVERDGR